MILSGPEFSQFLIRANKPNKSLEPLEDTKPVLRCLVFFFFPDRQDSFRTSSKDWLSMPCWSPFLELPLQHTPLRSSVSTGNVAMGSAEAQGSIR